MDRSRSSIVSLAIALWVMVSASTSAGPPPFQGHVVLGTVGITARDHYPTVGAIMDRLPGDDVELASAFRIGDAVVMKVLILNFGEQSHQWTVRGEGVFRRRLPDQQNQPPPTVSHDVLAAPVTHFLGPYELREFDLIVTGVPDYVLCGQLDLNVIITGPFQGQISALCPWFLYRVVTGPKAPMDPAWTEVLDDACTFATGASTEDQVFDLCTFHLFHAYKFAYDGKMPNYWLEEKLGYALTYMIDYDRGNGSDPLPADCQDVSAYLSLCVMSSGFDAGLMRLVEEDPNAPAFVTNSICPIGLASNDAGNYSQSVWSLHQVTTRAGVSLFRVYDACAAQKWTPAGATYWNPPRDWSLNAYWQTPNPGVPGRTEAFFGLVERPYGAPTPQYVPLGFAAFAVQDIF